MTSDPPSDAPAGPALPPLSAGTLLREARRAQGLHIAALAAAMKVSPRKLELLETDRFDELPDASFARALAQSVCRQLKIDPQPVLSRLPRAPGQRLDRLEGGLNAPFRERPGRPEPDESHRLSRPIVWVPLLLVVGTLLVLFVPFDFRFDRPSPGGSAGSPPSGSETVTGTSGAVAPSASSGQGSGAIGAGPAPASPPVVADMSRPPDASSSPDGSPPAPVASAAAPGTAVVDDPAPSPEPATAAEPAASGVVQISAASASWVQLVDARGRKLLSRELRPGEQLALDGEMPMRLTVGNVAATRVLLRGQPVDLSASGRSDNVARLQLK